MVFDPNKQKVPPFVMPPHIRILGTTWVTSQNGGVGPIVIPAAPFPPVDLTLANNDPFGTDYFQDIATPPYRAHVFQQAPYTPGDTWQIFLTWSGGPALSNYVGPQSGTYNSPVGVYVVTDAFSDPFGLTIIEIP